MHRDEKKKINSVCFDTENKEYVMVSNACCVLDHSTPEAYRAAHDANDGQCLFEASEAIALRVLGVRDGSPVIAWTYRGVRHDALEPTQNVTTEEFRDMMTGDGSKGKAKKNFVGRV